MSSFVASVSWRLQKKHMRESDHRNVGKAKDLIRFCLNETNEFDSSNGMPPSTGSDPISDMSSGPARVEASGPFRLIVPRPELDALSDYEAAFRIVKRSKEKGLKDITMPALMSAHLSILKTRSQNADNSGTDVKRRWRGNGIKLTVYSVSIGSSRYDVVWDRKRSRIISVIGPERPRSYRTLSKNGEVVFN